MEREMGAREGESRPSRNMTDSQVAYLINYFNLQLDDTSLDTSLKEYKIIDMRINRVIGTGRNYRDRNTENANPEGKHELTLDDKFWKEFDERKQKATRFP